IGPWAHGECRNGGFPDWLVRECGDTLRTQNEPYAFYMHRFLRAVAEQVKGLPLFGIQIENEMTNRPDYLESVRCYVSSLGLHAPLFTATAWGNADLPDTLLPMFGGYPEAPWEGHTHVLDPNPNYFFAMQREDGNIGTDLLGTGGITEDRYLNRFPFLSCEVGGGNQVTYHRRPLFSASDITALAMTKIGNGVNLLGYYMYAGGLNPIGHTTMQESRESGYPNDCPVISYDFQAPIGDMGQIRESYTALSDLHTFLHSFGEILAPMQPCLPDIRCSGLSDTETLRCALRTDGTGGFLFVNNHIREKKLPAHPDTVFCVDFMDRSISFSVDIPEDSSFFLPVGMTFSGTQTAYICAQPLKEEDGRLTVLRIPGVMPYAALPGQAPVLLYEGVNRLGGLEIVLAGRTAYRPSVRVPIPAEPLDENRCSAVLLLGHLRVHDAPLPDLTKEYRIRWSADTCYLVTEAKGNLAGFYTENSEKTMTLVSDCYLSGDKFVVDVRGIGVHEGILKIQPLRAEDAGTIYLEVPFVTGDVPPAVYGVSDTVLYI
ncbi:MAG: beta-galactosidase, partial [Eubacteriales bacterium]